MKIEIGYFVLMLATLFTDNLPPEDKSLYKIVKIKSIHNYYVIYASKDNLKYKIVSKKQKTRGCVRIKKNEEYRLELNRLQFLGGSEVNCVSFDKRTVICKCGDEDCDYGLFMTANLQGLCFIEEQFN